MWLGQDLSTPDNEAKEKRFRAGGISHVQRGTPPGTGWHRGCVLAHLSQSFMSSLASDPLLSTGKRTGPGRGQEAAQLLPSGDQAVEKLRKTPTLSLHFWVQDILETEVLSCCGSLVADEGHQLAGQQDLQPRGAVYGPSLRR